MSEENIEIITRSDSNFGLTFVDHHVLSDVNFNERYLINNNISVNKKVINLYISCILNQWSKNSKTYFILKNYLFGLYG